MENIGVPDDIFEQYLEKLKSEGQDLAYKFFDKDQRSGVDFEIALAAVLATICLQYPVQEAFLPLSEMSAFALLLITLSRRIIVSSPYASEVMLERSVFVLEVVTTSCMICIFVALSNTLRGFLQLPLPQTFVLLSLVFTFSAAIVHEFVLRDYLIWWHAKFVEKAEAGDWFSDIWVLLAIFSLWGSRYYRKMSGRDLYDSSLPPKEELVSVLDVSWTEYFRFVLRVVVLLVFVYSIALIVSFATVGVTGLLLIPAIVALHDHSAFWYIGYGDTSYEDFRKPVIWISIVTLIYFVETVLLLSMSPSGVLFSLV